jgi:uncharacterized membrane protein (UPF0127 family)
MGMCGQTAKLLGIVVLAAGLAPLAAGCIGASGNDPNRSAKGGRQFPLDTLPASTVTINDHAFRVWLALTAEHREEGLMWVAEDQLADDQGMLFVFPDERDLGFYMKNTITPLDIAFARWNGTIVATHTMPPLTLQTFPSYEPAMFALEVKAGTFERLGIAEGDRIVIPEDVFKAIP